MYVIETQTFLLAKRPERRGMKRNGCFCRLACPICLSHLPVCLSAYLSLLLGPRIRTVSQEPRLFDSQVFSASFLSVELKVAFNTRLKKKHLLEEGGKMSARLAQP